jgi:hypothetical protein
MAKIKNTGHQPRGFNTADGGHVIVPPGGEADVNMTEADHKHLTKLLEEHDDPKPFEISGGHEAEAKKKEKKEGDVEMPAQSTEPPPATSSTVVQPTTVPMTDRERREREAASKKEEHATHRK